jgi:hypothetical protein
MPPSWQTARYQPHPKVGRIAGLVAAPVAGRVATNANDDTRRGRADRCIPVRRLGRHPDGLVLRSCGIRPRLVFRAKEPLRHCRWKEHRRQTSARSGSPLNPVPRGASAAGHPFTPNRCRRSQERAGDFGNACRVWPRVPVVHRRRSRRRHVADLRPRVRGLGAAARSRFRRQNATTTCLSSSNGVSGVP